MTLFQIPGVMEIIRNDLSAKVKDKSLIQTMEEAFYRAYKPEYHTSNDVGNKVFMDSVWLYTSLLDAALNDKAYNAAKYDCEKEWDNAVRWLKFELGKRKMFTGKMIYDVAKLTDMAAASVDCLKPNSCGQNLTDWVQKNGESLTDFYELLVDLKKRLTAAAEKYKQLQASLNPD